MNESNVLFETTFGSKLYGLAHAGSDNDTYRVVSELGGRRKNKTKHVIDGKEDVFTIDLKSFLYQVHVGMPNALEAMFSTVATAGPLEAYRQGFRISLPVMHESYRERVTVESRGGLKQRRHALRWALNFREALNRGGVFNPTLSEEDARWVIEMSSSPDYCKAIKEAFPYEISLDEDRINKTIEEESVN